MRFEIGSVDMCRGNRMLAGATLGQSVYTQVLKPRAASRRPDEILLLSFRGAEFVTSSFLKATWLPLHPTTAEDAAVPCVVAHLRDDTRTEFDTFLRGHRLPGIEAVDWTKGCISRGRLHGHLEDATLSALTALCAQPGATAPELQRTSNDNVSPTAWTNRLNELHRIGLAFREKAGRAWKFFPLVKEFSRG